MKDVGLGVWLKAFILLHRKSEGIGAANRVLDCRETMKSRASSRSGENGLGPRGGSMWLGESGCCTVIGMAYLMQTRIKERVAEERKLYGGIRGGCEELIDRDLLSQQKMRNRRERDGLGWNNRGAIHPFLFHSFMLVAHYGGLRCQKTTSSPHPYRVVPSSAYAHSTYAYYPQSPSHRAPFCTPPAGSWSIEDL